MKIDDRTYFEEEQTMDSRWMWFFALFFFLTLMGVGLAFLFDKDTDWVKIILVLGAIAFSDGLILYLFKTMKLELAITKKAFHYRFFAMIASQGAIDWSEIQSITIKKSPSRGYGKKIKFKYGELYTMNTKKGVEFELKNGKKKFFSLKDPDSFRQALTKIEKLDIIKSSL